MSISGKGKKHRVFKSIRDILIIIPPYNDRALTAKNYPKVLKMIIAKTSRNKENVRQATGGSGCACCRSPGGNVPDGEALVAQKSRGCPM